MSFTDNMLINGFRDKTANTFSWIGGQLEAAGRKIRVKPKPNPYKIALVATVVAVAAVALVGLQLFAMHYAIYGLSHLGLTPLQYLAIVTPTFVIADAVFVEIARRNLQRA